MLMTQVPTGDRHSRSAGAAPALTGLPPRWPSEVSVAVAVGCCAPTAVVAWLAGAGAYPVAGLALFTVVAAFLAAMSGGWGAGAAALLMWATDDGFVIHRFGVLSLDGRSVRALVVIACVAAGVYGAALMVRATASGDGLSSAPR